MRKTYRTGIIGLGRIGFTLGFDRKREQPASHSFAFAAHPRINLAGGFDTDHNKMARWKKSFPKAKIYTTIEEMMHDGNWDIIIIAVPAEEHLPVISNIFPFRPRLIVLEKPVALNLKDSLKIGKLSAEYQVPVCINHERRFSRDYNLVKEWVESKKYGDILTIQASLLLNQPAALSLVHDATHLFDIISFLLNEPIKFKKIMSSWKIKKGPVSVLSILGRAGKSPVTIHIAESKALVFELDLLFKTGRVRVGNGLFEAFKTGISPFYDKFYSLLPDKKVPGIKKTGYFSGMVSNCIDFLDEKNDLKSALNDGIYTMRLVDKIMREIKE